MTFLFLFLFTLACLPDNWQGLTLDVLPLTLGFSVASTWAGVLVLAALAAVLARWISFRLQQDPEQSEEILLSFRRWRFLHLLAMLGFYVAALVVLGWGWAVQTMLPLEIKDAPQMLPGAELLILAPFLASLFFSWACFYEVDRTIFRLGWSPTHHQPFWSRWAQVRFQFRHNLALVLLPIGLLILMKGLRRVFYPYEHEVGFQLLLVGLLGMAYLGFPWMLRWTLRLRPLPEGPLRQRLQAAGRRLRFRYSNILVWDTNGGVANAMVAGLLPWIRYVVLTDRLIAELAPAEIEAVFGHEVGHIKHRHILFYLCFLVISLAVLAGLWNLIALFGWNSGWSMETNPDLEAIPVLGILGAYIFIVFGFLSRRCERQADLYGCRAVSCPLPACGGHESETTPALGKGGLCPTGIRTFIAALEKVASLNGIHRQRPGWLQSWQHSTIARRVEFLQQVLDNPRLEKRFQRKVRLVNLGFILGLVAVWLVLGVIHNWDWNQIRPF